MNRILQVLQDDRADPQERFLALCMVARETARRKLGASPTLNDELATVAQEGIDLLLAFGKIKRKAFGDFVAMNRIEAKLRRKMREALPTREE